MFRLVAKRILLSNNSLVIFKILELGAYLFAAVIQLASPKSRCSHCRSASPIRSIDTWNSLSFWPSNQFAYYK